MAEPLKNMYDIFFFEKLCPVLHDTIPGFDSRRFTYRVFDGRWPDLELKQRVRQITHALHEFLPRDFSDAAPLLVELSKRLRQKFPAQGFALIFLADYIEVYGLDHYHEAVYAMEEITQLVSAEFAARQFLLRYPEPMMQQMFEWSRHPSDNVRRLASEGCRPRLPWAIKVPFLKQDPRAILRILENLKQDASEYVRRSVANNLNDIAKDHPDLVLQTACSWINEHPHTDWILRHGCRTLLKRGNKDALMLFGFSTSAKGLVRELMLRPHRVKVGDELHFSFLFENREREERNFRLEYAIDYVTSTGKKSKKVFKIREGAFAPLAEVRIERKQPFRDFTTRKHYEGEHTLHVLVNGQPSASSVFIVT
jgi:3-methyladenine DNA glycosylase AlkC